MHNLKDVFLHPVIVSINAVPPDIGLLGYELAVLHSRSALAIASYVMV